MRLPARLLLHALREPRSVAAWNECDWEAALPSAKAAGLLARIVAQVRGAGVAEACLPVIVQNAAQAMNLLAEQQVRTVQWETRLLEESLAPLRGPILLLKGAAYAAAGLAPATGRVFTDIDLMVPVDQIAQAEDLLRFSGWISTEQDAYDQRYYRQWMHELPPMQHMKRGTSLDLHHRLLPLTARLQTDPVSVFEAAERIPGSTRLWMPSELDRILHSACHLFHEGEWGHGLRDLSDLDLLLREALKQRGERLWPELFARASRLHLGRPLFYALRYTRRLFATPVPKEIAEACPSAPSRIWRPVMDAVFLPALTEGFEVKRSTRSEMACALLYIRSHFLRMPLHLLLPHLLTKAWRGLRERPSTLDTADRAEA